MSLTLGRGLVGRTLPPSGGGSVAVVVGVSYGVIDTAGGGERVVVEVDDSTGVTGIKSDTGGGEVAWTSVTIDDATHVSGVPGAHAAGVVDVVVTNATGDSTTGTGLLEYFAPHDLGPRCELLPGDYAVTGTQGVDAVGTWTDSSGSGYNAESVGGVDAPVDDGSGNPDLDGTASVWLRVAHSMGSSSGSPPDMAELATGTQISCVEADTAGAPSAYYDDCVVAVGSGASAGLSFSTDGLAWEAYDEGALADYRKITATAAATGVKHFTAARWNGTTWSHRANGGAFTDVTNDAGVLSDGNVGTATDLGQSYGAVQNLDGRLRLFLMFDTALSDANVTKIYRWAQQRGIAA